ncbi:unnamed protein product [Pleuronectes platessa]|uniref:Uncharacterized protein n=1 Tax=Pleuronectes platessa TaxID=8262 RepID=A0A9N7Y1Q2_PLEPL|nr:unnamed protein product [Pleuronectes platessa]
MAGGQLSDVRGLNGPRILPAYPEFDALGSGPCREFSVRATALLNMASDGMILTNHDHQIRVGVLTGLDITADRVLCGEAPACGSRQQLKVDGVWCWQMISASSAFQEPGDDVRESTLVRSEGSLYMRHDEEEEEEDGDEEALAAEHTRKKSLLHTFL